MSVYILYDILPNFNNFLKSYHREITRECGFPEEGENSCVVYTSLERARQFVMFLTNFANNF